MPGWANNSGGVYIKGDVSSLKFSTASGRQVIEVKQGTATTTFAKQANGSWTVTTPTPTSPAQTLPSTGKFNGMIYVEGAVADLGGDGTDAPDIAGDSEITLTTATEKDRDPSLTTTPPPPNVTIKRDLTYAVDATQEIDPATGEMPRNVLGIFSVSGSTLLDGAVDNKDLTVHASIMASANGKGFGTVNATTRNRGTVDGRKVRINLLGGVIEDQSQTVGTTGAEGYARNYNYDRRFKTGFTPPFFPIQENWTTDVDPFHRVQGLWQTVKN